jgi:hypothetical protein
MVLLGLFVLIGWCWWVGRMYPERDYAVAQASDLTSYLDHCRTEF